MFKKLRKNKQRGLCFGGPSTPLKFLWTKSLSSWSPGLLPSMGHEKLGSVSEDSYSWNDASFIACSLRFPRDALLSIGRIRRKRERQKQRSHASSSTRAKPSQTDFSGETELPSVRDSQASHKYGEHPQRPLDLCYMMQVFV